MFDGGSGGSIVLWRSSWRHMMPSVDGTDHGHSDDNLWLETMAREWRRVLWIAGLPGTGTRTRRKAIR